MNGLAVGTQRFYANVIFYGRLKINNQDDKNAVIGKHVEVNGCFCHSFLYFCRQLNGILKKK